MPYLEEHGIGSANLIVPLMSAYQLSGKIIAINDKYYLEAINFPYVFNKRDRKTHKLISTVNTAYDIYRGKGILSGDFYIGIYWTSNNQPMIGKFNLRTGALTTNLGYGSFGDNQPSGFYHNGYSYFLKSGTSVLKYDNFGNEVMSITVPGVSSIMGASGNKLYFGTTNAGFIIIDLNAGTQLASYVPPGNHSGYTLWNANFLKNGNMIVFARYSDSLWKTFLLETTNGLTYTLKVTLLDYGCPVMIDSRKEWFYINESRGVPRIVDNQLNTIYENIVRLRLTAPYETVSGKDKYIYSNNVSMFGSSSTSTNGAIITKGVII